MVKNLRIEVDTMEALEIAIAAFRLNNNFVRQYTDAGEWVDNKTLVSGYFFDRKKFGGCNAKDLKAAAIELRDGIRGCLTMSMLTTGQVPDFQKKISDLIEKETMSSVNFGLLVWAPKVFADVQKAEKAREDIMIAGAGSRFQGQVGQKITVDFTPITVRFLSDYNCYAHNGHDGNGNLISFLNKAEFKAGKITAKVKAHKQDPRNCNYSVTNLNFVKAVK